VPLDSKYLGLPLFLKTAKSTSFCDIIEKVQNQINGWKAKTLSQAGKSTLIKAVVSALPTYAMSSFYLSKQVCISKLGIPSVLTKVLVVLVSEEWRI